MIEEWQQGDYVVSTDPARIDLAVVHGFLSTSYWAVGIPVEGVRRSLEHSLAFGLYAGQRQIGLARIITDYTTFAYVADVFVLDEFRGQGLGKWLMERVVAHPALQGLRRWMLATRDAHGLYRHTGFKELQDTWKWMERRTLTSYQNTERPATDGSE